MPAVIPGVSLFGFLPQQNGVHYLQNECVPPNPGPAALVTEWQTAAGKLGPPPPNVGTPNISDVPTSHQAYVAQIKASPHWAPVFAANPSWEIKMVEAAPLLAFQFAIVDGKVATHSAAFSTPTTMDELFNVCLPMTPVSEPFHALQQGAGVLIRSRSLNLRPIQIGQLSPIEFGVRIGVALPFVHVVRYNGRCYIHNGYHRCYGAAAAGATEIPCVFRDVQTPQEASIYGWPHTFDLAMLESANPPTLHHFASGQAHPVSLIEKTRVVHVSVSDWVAPDY